jgi:hypothetical protein
MSLICGVHLEGGVDSLGSTTSPQIGVVRINDKRLASEIPEHPQNIARMLLDCFMTICVEAALL